MWCLYAHVGGRVPCARCAILACTQIREILVCRLDEFRIADRIERDVFVGGRGLVADTRLPMPPPWP